MSPRGDSNGPSPFVRIQEGTRLAIGYVGTPNQQGGGGEGHSSPLRKRLRSSSSQPERHSSSWEGDDIPSQLPSTYSLSDITSKNSNGRDTHLPFSSPVASNHRLEPTGGDIARTSTQGSWAPSAQRPNQHHPTEASQYELDQTTRRETQDRSDHGETAHTTATPTTAVASPRPQQAAPLPQPRYPSVPTSANPQPPQPSHPPLPPPLSKPSPPSPIVTPPTPPTSIQPFRTHVTPSLNILMNNADLTDRYKPQSITREPRVSERGHWLVDPSSWAPGLQVEFWQFLERMVGQGNAGWGVWCARENAREEAVEGGLEDGGRSGGGRGSEQASGGLGVVKVFCWGEVVRHVYLMLYVASKSKIRKTKAQWRDAEEEVVVQM
ncbi:hypothetical protein H2203_003732 [Taxawa tesnikishii (nom. ined.)]|nr:hypothetical protein H2203_003732 [Dothideales sp. JES 119]